MKNQYVGDVNDFAKYGLLRSLAGTSSTALRLGVMWYLTQDVANHDGRRTQYLTSPRPNAYSVADAALFERLAQIVQEQRRDILHIAESGVLPTNTVFFSRLLSANNRREWFEDGLERLSYCDLVFLDPDNGLGKAQARGPRPWHATVEEICRLHERAHSVVVIQFLHRLARHEEQLQAWMSEVRRLVPQGTPAPFALRWHARSSLGFLIVPTPAHSRVLEERTAQLLHGAWGRFFDHHPMRA